MNKHEEKTFLKKNIAMYAKKVHDIQREQVDPYIKLIEQNLSELYPALVDREDGVENWACDIVNATSNAEVIETLNRIESLLGEEDPLSDIKAQLEQLKVYTSQLEERINSYSEENRFSY